MKSFIKFKDSNDTIVAIRAKDVLKVDREPESCYTTIYTNDEDYDTTESFNKIVDKLESCGE